MMAVLEVDNISLSFSGVKALKGVSLSVGSGELVSVIGPNGAGKTSLFNCISGVYQPQTGRITLGDEPILDLAPHDVAGQGVARMFQNLALFDQMTVLENMMLGRHHHYKTSWWQDMLWLPKTKSEEIRHRKVVEDVIDFLHLERYRKMPVGILPYGIKKRVELGRALAMEPKLLLLDEPAAGLNQEETEDMARYILDIKDDLGITQVLIEHELHMVLDLADRIAVLDFGKKIADDTPAAIRKHPAVIEAYLGGAKADETESDDEPTGDEE
jgi:branched-chain amino acid transport system ATP-binding protein